MSAFMTSRVHRSALTQAAMVEQIIEPIEASWLFNELTRCNRLALHHRYGDPHPDQMDEEHREVVEAPLDPHVIIVAIGCWEYQCSEYDAFFKGYEAASHVMDELRNHLLQTLAYESTPEGYAQWHNAHRDSVGWGIETWGEVIATQQAAS